MTDTYYRSLDSLGVFMWNQTKRVRGRMNRGAARIERERRQYLSEVMLDPLAVTTRDSLGTIDKGGNHVPGHASVRPLSHYLQRVSIVGGMRETLPPEVDDF